MKCPSCGFSDDVPNCTTCGEPVTREQLYDVAVNGSLEHATCRDQRIKVESEPPAPVPVA